MEIRDIVIAPITKSLIAASLLLLLESTKNTEEIEDSSIPIATVITYLEKVTRITARYIKETRNINGFSSLTDSNEISIKKKENIASIKSENGLIENMENINEVCVHSKKTLIKVLSAKIPAKEKPKILLLLTNIDKSPNTNIIKAIRNGSKLIISADSIIISS